MSELNALFLTIFAAVIVGTVTFANWSYWTERWGMTPEEKKQADAEFENYW